jgi:hypothetical protein
MIGSAHQIRHAITHRAHPAVPPHHLLVHLQDQLPVDLLHPLVVHHHRALQRDQIKIAAVRIYRHVVVQVIVVGQLETLAMVVKSAIHAGFALLRKIVINRVFDHESLNPIFQKM